MTGNFFPAEKSGNGKLGRAMGPTARPVKRKSARNRADKMKQTEKITVARPQRARTTDGGKVQAV
jgi:hypothetical protein